MSLIPGETINCENSQAGKIGYFLIYFTEVDLQCCINLISALPQCDSDIYIYIHTYIYIYMYIYILFHILFHGGLSQGIEYSFLCHIIGPYCLLILYIHSICLC